MTKIDADLLAQIVAKRLKGVSSDWLTLCEDWNKDPSDEVAVASTLAVLMEEAIIHYASVARQLREAKE